MSAATTRPLVTLSLHVNSNYEATGHTITTYQHQLRGHWPHYPYMSTCAICFVCLLLFLFVMHLLCVLPGCAPRPRQRSCCGLQWPCPPTRCTAQHHHHGLPPTQMRRKPSPASMLEWAHVSGSPCPAWRCCREEPLTCAHSTIEVGLGFLLICVEGTGWQAVVVTMWCAACRMAGPPQPAAEER